MAQLAACVGPRRRSSRKTTGACVLGVPLVFCLASVRADDAAAIRRGPQLTLDEDGNLAARFELTKKVENVFVRVLDKDLKRSYALTWASAPIDAAGVVHRVALSGHPEITRDGAVHRWLIGGDGLAPAWFELKAPPIAGGACEFAVLGDTGQGTKEQTSVAALLASLAPDFVLHTGDVIYPWGSDDALDRLFFKPYASTLARAPFFTSLGDHDLLMDQGKAELAAFAYPPNKNGDRFYSFDYGACHVAVLDSNPIAYALAKDPPFGISEQAKWLERDLPSARAPWKIVVLHHPLRSAFVERASERALLRAALEPIFEKHHVDVVFAGHDHFYFRTRARGVLHVTTGGGGAVGYHGKIPEDDAAAGAKLVERHHVVHARVDGTTMHLRAIAPSASGSPDVIDEITLAARRVR